jgi:serine/threonine-protein kinase
MGTVWRAEHLTLRTDVAVKLIEPQLTDSDEAIARFQREARAAAGIRSVNVVKVMDYGFDEGVPFIVMELLEGETLRSRLRRVRRLSALEVGNILYQVSRALEFAHAQGIVHRDLKPENIYIVREGHDELVKVLDFGVAKRYGEITTDTSSFCTTVGAVIGTPHYLSPEQAIGSTDIDHRVDIWAFGVVAFECLTGVRPFNGDTLGALLMAICSGPIPVPSAYAQVPAGFDGWFERAVARNPKDRFDSILEAVTFLRVVIKLASTKPPSATESL